MPMCQFSSAHGVFLFAFELKRDPVPLLCLAPHGVFLRAFELFYANVLFCARRLSSCVLLAHGVCLRTAFLLLLTCTEW